MTLLSSERMQAIHQVLPLLEEFETRDTGENNLQDRMMFTHLRTFTFTKPIIEISAMEILKAWGEQLAQMESLTHLTLKWAPQKPASITEVEGLPPKKQNRQNEMVIQKAGKMVERKYLHRAEWSVRNQSHNVVVDPPTPRLIGIELNPGPPTSAPLPPSPSSVILFRDGLELIFSVLDGQDWLRAVRSCREWFAIAASSRQTVSIRRASPLALENPKRTFWERLLGKKKQNSENEVALVSPWQLASHINELIFIETGWFALCSFMKSRRSVLTQLTRVTVHWVQYEVPLQRTMQDNGRHSFPPSLTSITLSSPHTLGCSRHAENIILSTLGVCTRLTHLVLPQSSWMSPQFDVLHLSHLRILHAHTSILTSKTFHQFSINLPQLEVLTCNSLYSSQDLLDWSKLKQLRLMEFYFRPTLGEEVNPPPPAAALGRQLASMSNLSEIIFHHWWPHEIAEWETADEPELWRQLAQHAGPNLTSLHFYVTNGFNLLASLGDVTSSYSYDFFRMQLKSLKIETPKGGWQLEVVEDVTQLLDQLQYLTGLTSLTIQVWIDSAERFASVYHRFNDPTFLPHVSHCQGRFFHMQNKHSDTLVMKYNREDNQNYVFTRETAEDGRIFQTLPFEIYQPPSPRLVGIELNPGPSHDSRSPFASLFNDGLRSIFAYLSDYDFLNSAAVSRHWFTLARSSSRRFTYCIAEYRRRKAKQSIFRRIAAFFSPSSTKPPSSPSPWNFYDRITTLLVEDVSWEDYRSCLLPYTHLTSLQMKVANLSRGATLTKEDLQRSLQFPFTLRTLAIDIRLTANESPSQLQLLIDEIGSCTAMEKLDLSIKLYSAIRSYKGIRLSSLRQLLHLTHFSFHVETIPISFMHQLFEVVSSLPVLTHLQCKIVEGKRVLVDGVWMISAQLLTLADLTRLANVKQLQSIVMINRVLKESEALALHEACPQLRQLQYTSEMSHHKFPILLYSRFTQLRELCIQGEPTLGDGIAVGANPESRIIEEIARLKHLTHLTFHRWCPTQPESWSQLISSDALTSIAFERCNIDVSQQSPLLSNALCLQLTTLTFEYCKLPSQSGDSIFSFLRRFTSLTSLSFEGSLSSCVNPSVDVIDILDHLNVHAFLPRLRHINITESNIRDLNLEYDVDKRISRCTFRYQDEFGKQEWLTRPLHANSSIVEPPSPRLVGIELNPGPSAVSDDDRVLTLFQDGLTLCFAFVAELLVVATVHRVWFRVISHESLHIRLQVHTDDYHSWIPKKRSRFTRLKSRLSPKKSLLRNVRIDGQNYRCKVTPPASRLVGIELNPGPSTNFLSRLFACGSPQPTITPLFPSPASTLFNDGLLIIFSYLDASDWFRCARSSRHWINVAAHAASSQGICITKDWARLNSNAFKPAIICQDSPTQWNLSNRVTHFISHSMDWSDLLFLTPALCSKFLSLTRLQIDKLYYPKVTSIWDPHSGIRTVQVEAPNRALVLPPSLTQFQILSSRMDYDAPLWPISKSLLDAVGACPLLHTLQLPLLSPHNYCGGYDVPGVPLDFTPLLHLPQLTHLIFEVSLRHSDQIDACMTLLGQLETLTHLSLRINKNNIETITPQHFAMLKLPRVRELEITQVGSSEVINTLHSAMPQLESLIVASSTIDLNEWSRFTQLRRLVIDDQPILGANMAPSEVELADRLSKMVSLREMKFLLWTPSEELWKHLNTALASLTSLEFVEISTDPLRAFIDSHSSLLDQLQRLSFSKCRLSDDALSHEQLSALPSLTSLECISSLSRLFGRQIYTQFNDSNHMPTLRRISISGRREMPNGRIDQVRIEYDLDRNLNECNFTGAKEDERILWRGAKRKRIEDQPPSSRLVGIELNPGPLIVSAESLFSDGIFLVQSYLSDRDWIVSARVCHRWFKLSSKTALVKRPIHRIDTIRRLSIPLTTKIVRFLCSLLFAAPAINPSNRIRWSLIRYVTQLTIAAITVNQLEFYLRPYPSSLTSLTISQLDDGGIRISDSTLVFQLPTSLLTLTASLTSSFKEFRQAPQLVQRLLTSVAELRQLRSLHLDFPPFNGLDLSPSDDVDLKVLHSLNHLERLHIRPHSPYSMMLNRLFRDLTHLRSSQLRELHFELDSNSNLRVEIYPGMIDHISHHCALTSLTLAGAFISHISTLKIGGSIPQLQYLEAAQINMVDAVLQQQKEAMKNDLTGAHSLSTLFPVMHTCIGVYAGFSESESHNWDTRVNALCSAFSPHFMHTLITIDSYLDQHSWDRVCAHYPLLTQPRQELTSTNLIKSTPPAPRLVGIELNPGPPKNLLTRLFACTNAPSSPQPPPTPGVPSPLATLFNDGLLLIFSYLHASEWLICVRSCRHWITVAASSSQQIQLVKNWFALNSDATKHSTSPVRWNLANRITRLVLPNEAWADLLLLSPQLSAKFPSLQYLRIDKLHYPKVDMIWSSDQYSIRNVVAEKLPHEVLVLPSSLTHLEIIAAEIQHDFPMWSISKSLLDAVGECPLLHTVRLPLLSSDPYARSNWNLPPVPVLDFSPLIRVPHLTHLTIVISQNEASHRAACCAALSQLSSMVHLTVSGDRIMQFHMTPDEIAQFRLSSMREFDFSVVVGSPDMMRTIYTAMPQLEFLRVGSRTIDLTEWSRFTHLRRIEFFERPYLGTNYDPSDVELAEQVLKMVHLREMKFTSWTPSEELWQRINIASLTSLEFVQTVKNPLPTLLDSRSSLLRQLQRLSFTNIPLDQEVLTHQLLNFASLTSLECISSLPHLIGRQVYTQLNDPTHMPSLRAISISTNRETPGGWFGIDYVKIEFDVDRNLNTCSFRGAKEDEQKLWRGKWKRKKDAAQT